MPNFEMLDFCINTKQSPFVKRKYKYKLIFLFTRTCVLMFFNNSINIRGPSLKSDYDSIVKKLPILFKTIAKKTTLKVFYEYDIELTHGKQCK